MADEVTDGSGYIKKMSDLGLMGTSPEAITEYMMLLEAEAQKKFPGDSLEAKQSRNSYKEKGILSYIDVLGKQYTAVTTNEAGAQAIKKQIENTPDVRKKALEDALIPLMLKHGQIDLATFEDWKNRFNKHQDEIISAAISAKISPYQAMAGVASLGILFGGIAQMVGMATDKPEWAEFGAKTMAWSTQLAQKAGDEILKLDKEGKILKNIDRTPEGFEQAMNEQQKRIASQAHYTMREIILLSVDDPERRASHLASWAKSFEQHCAAQGIECPGSVRSVRGNNPGNLRPVGASQGFQTFATPEAGLQAMYDDLAGKITGKSKAMADKLGKNYSPTLQNLITVWAPPKDKNDTAAYIARVSKETGIKSGQVLTVADIPKLMPSMIAHEGGPEAVAYFKPTFDKMFGSVKATPAPVPPALTPKTAPKKARGHASADAVITNPANQAFALAQPVPKSPDSRDVGHDAGVAVVAELDENKGTKVGSKGPATNDPIYRLAANGPGGGLAG